MDSMVPIREIKYFIESCQSQLNQDSIHALSTRVCIDTYWYAYGERALHSPCPAADHNRKKTNAAGPTSYELSIRIMMILHQIAEQRWASQEFSVGVSFENLNGEGAIH